METDLSILDKTRLEQCEAVIEHGLRTFVDVGNALQEIRDNRLYRAEFSAFEDYCQERWGFSKRYANYQIEAAQTISNLGTIVPTLPATESQARPLASLPPEQQIEAWQRAIDTAPDGRVTAAHVQQVVDEIQEKRPVSYHVSDDSYEWYTPKEYIEAARGLMGSIDLDPASCEDAQKIIEAGTYYTKEVNGLSQKWFGNIWINPPYNMPLVDQFTKKAVDDYRLQKIKSAVILVNNATDTEWFHRLLNYPVCFTNGRVKFWTSAGPNLGARQGQAIFYLGDNLDLFGRLFSVFGAVMVRYDYK